MSFEYDDPVSGDSVPRDDFKLNAKRTARKVMNAMEPEEETPFKNNAQQAARETKLAMGLNPLDFMHGSQEQAPDGASDVNAPERSFKDNAQQAAGETKMAMGQTPLEYLSDPKEVNAQNGHQPQLPQGNFMLQNSEYQTGPTSNFEQHSQGSGNRDVPLQTVEDHDFKADAKDAAAKTRHGLAHPKHTEQSVTPGPGLPVAKPPSLPIVEVIGVANREKAEKLAHQAVQELKKKGVNLSKGKVVVNAKTKDIQVVPLVPTRPERPHDAAAGGPPAVANETHHADAAFTDGSKEVNPSSFHNQHEQVRQQLEKAAIGGELGAVSEPKGEFASVGVKNAENPDNAEHYAEEAVALLESKGHKLDYAREIIVDGESGLITDEKGQILEALDAEALARAAKGEPVVKAASPEELAQDLKQHPVGPQGHPDFEAGIPVVDPPVESGQPAEREPEQPQQVKEPEPVAEPVVAPVAPSSKTLDSESLASTESVLDAPVADIHHNEPVPEAPWAGTGLAPGPTPATETVDGAIPVDKAPPPVTDLDFGAPLRDLADHPSKFAEEPLMDRAVDHAHYSAAGLVGGIQGAIAGAKAGAHTGAQNTIPQAHELTSKAEAVPEVPHTYVDTTPAQTAMPGSFFV